VDALRVEVDSHSVPGGTPPDSPACLPAPTATPEDDGADEDPDDSRLRLMEAFERWVLQVEEPDALQVVEGPDRFEVRRP
jgi:hypothetical protein